MRLRTVLLIGFLAVLAAAGQFALAKARPMTGSAAAESAFAAFGGFRSIASEIVWFRADRLQDEGRYVELAQLAMALTLSEPHTPEVWSYASWNLAYNVSVMMPDHADRWRWVKSAIELLRDDGLPYNPRSADLRKELAMLFEFKLALDIDEAAPRYRLEWRKIIDDVAARGAWSELGMWPEKMARLEGALGITDRGDPLYSAVYWALDGLPYADKRTTPFLNEILRQSVTLYRKNRSLGPRQ